MVLSNSAVNLSEGLMVTGLKNTAQALNDGLVRRLLICANLAPSAGWQCRDCLALCTEMDVQPEKCPYCGSTQIYATDLKTEMIARAYQLGCAIEIMSRSPELERVGGIGAFLYEGRL